MIELVAALALAPWTHPLSFLPQPGWHTGASGTVPSLYGGADKRVRSPRQSTAWIATNDVRYRDTATADPPNRTLAHLPANGVVVWAVIFQSSAPGQEPVRLDLGRAKRFECCEGAYVAGGEHELTGAGPRGAYSVIVRIYFGSRPTRTLRAKAQQAIDRLELPPPP